MSLSCFRSSDPNVTSVRQLYDADDDHGALWSGSGAAPLCAATSPPPPPSRCVVCFHRRVYAVCSDSMRNVTLVMEGEGHIDITGSDCPVLRADGAWQWQWLLLLLLLLILLVVWCIRRTCKKASAQLERERPEEEPMADAAV